MVEHGSNTNLTFPHFDVKHHNLLCSELKQLYVMLTRARQRLWIYDECIENHQPMLDYWMASGLVRAKQLDASLAEELRCKSSAEDWNKRGVKMFNEHHYDAAELCFKRAGDTAKAQHAKAASLQQEAEKLRVTNPKEATRILQEAAQLYISIEKGENAAKCFHKIGDFKMVLYTKTFVSLRTWKLQVKAAAHYHQGKNVKEMMKFVLMFPTLTMRRSFLKRRDYTDQLQEIEEAAGNFGKAAELAEANGNLKHAAKLFERAGFISLAVEKLLHFASMQIHWKDGNKGLPRLLTPEVTQVLQHAQSLAIQNESAVGAALICELQILQNVSCTKIHIYKENYEQSRKLKVIRLELLSSYLLLQELAQTVRRAIEQEGVENILAAVGNSREQVSDLAEVWDNWSRCIVFSIHALDRLQKGRGREEDEPILQCIYSYLGVARHSQPHIVVVENSKAHWLANSSISASTNGKINQLSVQEFAHLALQFFGAQLLEIGELLETVFSDFCKAVEGIKHMVSIQSNLVHVLLLRFKALRLVLDADACDGTTRVQVKAKIIEVITQLYDLLFIHMPFHSMKEVHVIRESPDALLLFDILAKHLSQNEMIPEQVKTTSVFKLNMSYDELGKLLTLHPFLGNDWALGEASRKVEENLVRSAKNNLKVRLWNGSQSQHNVVLKSIQPTMHCTFWSRSIEWFMSSLRDIYRKEDFNVAGYISPLVFLALFERGVVATCACSTHLTSTLVTESMALCYMAGKHFEPYYSMLLNSTCDGGCRTHLQGVLLDAAQLILELLFQVLELEKWFQLSGLNKGMYLPLVILRLINLIFTICINTEYERIHREVIQGLTTLIAEKSPVLAELPSHFYEELRKPFTEQQPPIWKLATAFSLAMELMGDPVIVLMSCIGHPHAGMSWHTSVEKNLKLQLQKYGPSRFSLGDLECSTNANKTVREKIGSESNDNDLHKEDEGDCEKLFIKDAQENEFLGEILEASQDNNLQDSFNGSVKPDQTVPPCSIQTSDSIILEDGTRLSRACVEQMKRVLAAARERILIPLTPVETYQREARSVFLRKGITDKVYIDLFYSKACSLLVHVDEHLMELNKALGLIKGGCEGLDDEGDLLEDFSEHKEKLEEARKDLNPKCIIHEDMDQFWLHEEIEGVKVLLEYCQNKLQGPLKKVFKAAGNLEPPTSKSTLAQKSPQPNKGKKNKRKKHTKRK